MSERPKERDWKSRTRRRRVAGSNPALSAGGVQTDSEPGSDGPGSCSPFCSAHPAHEPACESADQGPHFGRERNVGHDADEEAERQADPGSGDEEWPWFPRWRRAGAHAAILIGTSCAVDHRAGGRRGESAPSPSALRKRQELAEERPRQRRVDAVVLVVRVALAVAVARHREDEQVPRSSWGEPESPKQRPDPRSLPLRFWVKCRFALSTDDGRRARAADAVKAELEPPLRSQSGIAP